MMYCYTCLKDNNELYALGREAVCINCLRDWIVKNLTIDSASAFLEDNDEYLDFLREWYEGERVYEQRRQ